MTSERTRALSEVLDRLETAVRGESINVQDVVDELGQNSFAAMIMIFALLAASPASAIPGLTATVGLAVVILVAQMLIGRKCVWLPGFLARRRLSSERICRGSLGCVAPSTPSSGWSFAPGYLIKPRPLPALGRQQKSEP